MSLEGSAEGKPRGEGQRWKKEGRKNHSSMSLGRGREKLELPLIHEMLNTSSFSSPRLCVLPSVVIPAKNPASSSLKTPQKNEGWGRRLCNCFSGFYLGLEYPWS